VDTADFRTRSNRIKPNQSESNQIKPNQTKSFVYLSVTNHTLVDNRFARRSLCEGGSLNLHPQSLSATYQPIQRQFARSTLGIPLA